VYGRPAGVGALLHPFAALRAALPRQHRRFLRRRKITNVRTAAQSASAHRQQRRVYRRHDLVQRRAGMLPLPRPQRLPHHRFQLHPRYRSPRFTHRSRSLQLLISSYPGILHPQPTHRRENLWRTSKRVASMLHTTVTYTSLLTGTRRDRPIGVSTGGPVDPVNILLITSISSDRASRGLGGRPEV
jgi:hypothetical protein